MNECQPKKHKKSSQKHQNNEGLESRIASVVIRAMRDSERGVAGVAGGGSEINT
jgi:hypothetical protein